MDYLDFVKNSPDLESLAIRTAEYIQTNYLVQGFVLIAHQPSFNPFRLLICQQEAFNFERWKESLIGKNITPLPGKPLLEQEQFYYFPEADFQKEPFCFFIFSKEINSEIQKILKQWSHCTSLVNQIIRHTTEKSETERGALISQILHDVNTLISLQQTENPDYAAKARMAYQIKANEDLLFFIRPVELLPFKVSVHQLIQSSLQITGLKKSAFLLTISTDPAEITIDVELFSKAFNAILLNAVAASERTLSKIKISVDTISSDSPFISFNWLQIVVTDQGSGISTDYMDHIYEPFFTTRKANGHSGFGLTNAQKIITALNGHMQVSSVKELGTEVKILLPML